MGYRRFTDRDGVTWEVRERSRSDWELVPVDGRGPARVVHAPGYESDPFELSEEELQRLLGEAGPARRTKPPNPFGD